MSSFAASAITRPILDSFCQLPKIPAAVAQNAPIGSSGESARNGSDVVRVRIFANGQLGRSFDRIILITDLSGDARPQLDHIATEIKRLFLKLIPPDEIAWFYHRPDGDPEFWPNGHPDSWRGRWHDSIDRIDMSYWTAAELGCDRDIFLGFCLVPVSRIELFTIAGGAIEL